MTTSPSPPRPAQAPIHPDPSYAEGIVEKSGEELFTCYQCLKCSTGCPVAFAMDILPHQMVRLVQLGLKDEVLKSRSIWLCASCFTCRVRCPNGIDIAHLMDSLKRDAIAAGETPGEKNIPIFHRTFLDAIRANGRIHEIGLLGLYKFRSGEFTKDVKLGMKMFAKGKIKLIPHRVHRMKEIRELFKQAQQRKER